jgi:hypothetical protein
MVFVIVPAVEKGFDVVLVVLVVDGAELFRDVAMESMASESEPDDELVAMLFIASYMLVSLLDMDIAFDDSPPIDPLILPSPLLSTYMIYIGRRRGKLACFF